MPIFKNVASQKCLVYAYDKTTGAAKTGDAGNITGAISLDGGGATATDDTNPSEVDSTDSPGFYSFNLTQGETNGDLFGLYAKSSTANILIEPVIAYTVIRPYISAAINDASATSDTFVTTLTSASNDFYNGAVISFVSGNLVNLSRPISDYTGASKTVIVSPAFPAAPDNSSQFVVLGYYG
jgi:hypothetical protein